MNDYDAMCISQLKNKNAFMEQTYLWAWINEENEIIKDNIILHYITRIQEFKI
jgi:hypothetical protein